MAFGTTNTREPIAGKTPVDTALTQKELQQSQGAAQVAISNEPTEDTFNALSSTISYNELSPKLKKEVRTLKTSNQLTQNAADQVINMHRSEMAEKVSKRINKPDTDIHVQESKAERKAKEVRMESERAFESVDLPDEISLSKFQKQFEKDNTVGQALKRVLKNKGVNIPQKALINVLLKIPGISEMNFGVFKHPDAKRGNRIQRFEEIKSKVLEFNSADFKIKSSQSIANDI
jgi:hypothetical protein